MTKMQIFRRHSITLIDFSLVSFTCCSIGFLISSFINLQYHLVPVETCVQLEQGEKFAQHLAKLMLIVPKESDVSVMEFADCPACFQVIQISFVFLNCCLWSLLLRQKQNMT